MVRTIEQILGAQPLNEKVAAATPMYGAFTNKPNYTPFNAVPNQIPLTEGIATAPACGLDTLGQTGAAAAALNRPQAATTAVPADETADRRAVGRPGLPEPAPTGNGAVPDYANPEQMNRYTWYQAHGWKVPYPGDTKIYAPRAGPRRATSRARRRTDESRDRAGHQSDTTARRSSGGPSPAETAGTSRAPAMIEPSSSPSARAGSVKSFGEVVALDGVDLDIAPGQVHGLVGPNGAGKTTLLGLLLGLAQADGGELEIFGCPVRRTLAAPRRGCRVRGRAGPVPLADRAAEPRCAGSPAGRRLRRHR